VDLKKFKISLLPIVIGILVRFLGDAKNEQNTNSRKVHSIFSNLHTTFDNDH